MGCQVGDRGAEARQRAALHAPPVRRQPALQREAAQVVQARQRSGVEHHILHSRVEHQLQADAAGQLVQVVGQREGGGLCQARPPNALVQVLQAGGARRGGCVSLQQTCCCKP